MRIRCTGEASVTKAMMRVTTAIDRYAVAAMRMVDLGSRSFSAA
jgi:hypothetical protein